MGILFAEAVLFWINEINPDALSLLISKEDAKKRMRISEFRFLFAGAVLIWITLVIQHNFHKEEKIKRYLSE